MSKPQNSLGSLTGVLLYVQSGVLKCCCLAYKAQPVEPAVDSGDVKKRGCLQDEDDRQDTDVCREMQRRSSGLQLRCSAYTVLKNRSYLPFRPVAGVQVHVPHTGRWSAARGGLPFDEDGQGILLRPFQSKPETLTDVT